LRDAPPTVTADHSRPIDSFAARAQPIEFLNMNVLQLDLHLHAGNERWGLPVSAFVEGAAARGVRLLGLLDHVEFYLPEKSDWIAGLYAQMDARKLEHYAADLSGLRRMYGEFDALARPAGMRIVRGLEFNNVPATPDEALAMPDYACFCFGDVSAEAGETFGQRAAARIRQVGAKVRPLGKPCIINHPFRNRLWLRRDALAAGSVLPADQYISRDDVRRMADAAGECGIALEVNLSDLTAYEQLAQRPVLELAISAYAELVAVGADLSIGSDSHAPPKPDFSPAVIETVQRAGITSRHIERIVAAVGE
jgi:histidinol phosphatase-like PHP family hydrolase